MIRCNLAILLAERDLKITKVANDTGISRTTLTSISKNTSQGVQLETLNKLCNYLKITPAEFFSYIPIDFDFSFFYDEDSKELYPNEPVMWAALFELFIRVREPRKESKSFAFQVSTEFDDRGNFATKVHIRLEDEKEKDELKEMLDKIPTTFLTDIEKEIISLLEEEVKSITPWTEFHFDWFGEDIKTKEGDL